MSNKHKNCDWLENYPERSPKFREVHESTASGDASSAGRRNHGADMMHEQGSTDFSGVHLH